MRAERQIAPGTNIVHYLLGLPLDLRRMAVARMGAIEREAVDRYWPGWAHDGQLAPAGEWSTWVVKAGRGFGKTRAGAEWITSLVAAGGKIEIALVGATLEDARRVMIEGRSGLLQVAGPWVREWHPSLRTMTFTTGARATLFSGASPDMLRGPEHHFAWCDELAKWEKPEYAWEMLQLGLRLGTHPRALITTTPKPGPVLVGIMDEPGTHTSGGGTRDNPHLSRAYQRRVEGLYAGTRTGLQELEGELLADAKGALWSVELIARCRGEVSADGKYRRTLIAVDPPSGDGTCGIIACARDRTGTGHVLADHSVTGRSPDGWARAVTAAAIAHETDEVIAESNQGGRMVKTILQNAGPHLRVRLVTASKSKSERADPVAHLFEAGRVVLHGEMRALEAQLRGMIAGGGYEGPGVSPDRADAMVWGIGELLLRKREVRIASL